MVWDSIQPNLQDVKRGHVKARLLTGTYMFQSTKSKFNSSEVDPKCPLCRLESEDLHHFILRCPALAGVRERHFPALRKLVIGVVGDDIWSQHFRNKDILVALVVDCQRLVDKGLLPCGPYGITIYRNGPERTETDRNGPERTETDFRGYRNGLSEYRNGRSGYRNGPERTETDFCEYRNRLCGYRIVIWGVKIDRNTKNRYKLNCQAVQIGYVE